MSLLRTNSRCFRQRTALLCVNKPGAQAARPACDRRLHIPAKVQPCSPGLLNCRLPGSVSCGLRSVSPAAANGLLAWGSWAARARPAVRRSSSLRVGASRHV
jgi:hypothetical protein